MECERLQRLVKSWYIQVQNETMAPARMVAFMEGHLADCHVCLADPLVRQEVEKITAIVLPPSKIRKPTAEDEEEPIEVAEDDAMSPFARDTDDVDEAEEGEGESGDEDDDMGDDLMDDEEEDDDL